MFFQSFLGNILLMKLFFDISQFFENPPKFPTFEKLIHFKIKTHTNIFPIIFINNSSENKISQIFGDFLKIPKNFPTF